MNRCGRRKRLRMTNPTKRHRGEPNITARLVLALIQRQFPQWDALPLTHVTPEGTDNVHFRLGDRWVVRLPRTAGAAAKISKEHQWLPLLRPHLPIPISVPVDIGRADLGYPFEWSILEWLPGRAAIAAGNGEPTPALAQELGVFVNQFHRLPVDGGPVFGSHNGYRGEPLLARDDETRFAIQGLGDLVNQSAMLTLWEDLSETTPYSGPPLWLHGDLDPRNLLVRRGRLSGVIDFGCLGKGDPAVDCMIAWTWLDRPSRAAFRQAADVDAECWRRGRGWALSWALIALPYYLHSDPVITRIARQTITAVFEDIE